MACGATEGGWAWAWGGGGRRRGPAAEVDLRAWFGGEKFRVWVLGFGFWVLGFGLEFCCSGCRVQGPGFRVQGAGSEVEDQRGAAGDRADTGRGFGLAPSS